MSEETVSEETVSEKTVSDETAHEEDGIVLGPTRYGKAEVRLVHVDRSTPVHKIKDVTVTSQLLGDFTAATHATGDNSAVIATDTQKNTVYALARLGGVGAIEDFALRMARNFVDKYEW